jgi:hypothetical protein
MSKVLKLVRHDDWTINLELGHVVCLSSKIIWNFFPTSNVRILGFFYFHYQSEKKSLKRC